MKNVTTQQIKKRIETENPWWSHPHQIPTHFSEMNPRPYFNLFFPLAAQREPRRATVLMGPRRVGKTVLMHHAIQALIDQGVRPREIFYVSVDHPIYNGLSLDDLLDYYAQSTSVDLSRQGCYVFFDEIQYLKDWETYLKSLVDTYPKLKAIASGSAAAALRLKSNESGAGRFTDFLLPPLTFHEYLHLLGIDEVMEVRENEESITVIDADIEELNEHFLNYLNFGGYPEVIFSPEIQDDPGRFIKSDIIDKVLLRDLPILYGITNIQDLNSLFTTLAFNTANEISLEELAQNSGTSKNTIKRYVEYLEAAFLVRVIKRVDRNAKRFQRQPAFKVYLTNPSIRSALFSPIDADHEDVGPLAETAIFAQWFHSEFERLYYARWKEGRKQGEIDIVRLDTQQRVISAIEVKWSDRFFNRPDRLQALLAFCTKHGLQRATVTTRTAHGEKSVGGISIDFVPTSVYCFLVGYQIVRGKRFRYGVLSRNT